MRNSLDKLADNILRIIIVRNNGINKFSKINQVFRLKIYKTSNKKYKNLI
jgi:hypothetical protein